MKTLLCIFSFCIITMASAQQLNTKPLQLLPLNYSLLNKSAINYQNIYNLQLNLKSFFFMKDENILEIRRGSFNINTNVFKDKILVVNFPQIDLTQELRKVMLQIPGETYGLNAKGFKL